LFEKRHFLIKNNIFLQIIKFDEEPEIFLYKYLIKFNSIDDSISNETCVDYREHKLHSIISVLKIFVTNLIKITNYTIQIFKHMKKKFGIN
jgi:hypothetical protein